jgi:ABC-2 type transport system permease protein
LVVVVAYWFIFRFVFPAAGNAPYALFLFVGLSTWTVFIGGSQAAASSLVANASLVTKVHFPRQIVPLAAMAGSWFTAAVMFVISVILCAFFGHGSRVAWLAVPPMLVLLLALTIGFGLLLAAINVYLRDVEHILGAITLPWFFLTPVLFSFDAIPDGEQWAIKILHYGNFVTPFILSIRGALFEGTWPAGVDVIYCVVAATSMLVAGLWTFRRLQDEMAVEL